MTAVAALNTRKAPRREKSTRVLAPCVYCRKLLSVPAKYNAVDYCPTAKRAAVGVDRNAPRFTLIDGHRVTSVDAQRTFRPGGFFARVRATFSCAWATWKATRPLRIKVAP